MAWQLTAVCWGLVGGAALLVLRLMSEAQVSRTFLNAVLVRPASVRDIAIEITRISKHQLISLTIFLPVSSLSASLVRPSAAVETSQRMIWNFCDKDDASLVACWVGPDIITEGNGKQPLTTVATAHHCRRHSISLHLSKRTACHIEIAVKDFPRYYEFPGQADGRLPRHDLASALYRLVLHVLAVQLPACG